MDTLVPEINKFLCTETYMLSSKKELHKKKKINQRAATPNFPVPAVKKLFSQIAIDFAKREKDSEKTVYKYTVLLKDGYSKLKISIIYANDFYWLCKVHGAQFNCDTMYLSSYLKNSINGSFNISFDKATKCSIVELNSDFNNLETDFILITKNYLVYPVHECDFLDNRVFLKKTFSEYLLFCKDFIYIFYYILLKLNEDESIDDILYCHDSFPNDIKCKIKCLRIILESNASSFQKLNKQYKIAISTSDNAENVEILRKSISIVLDELKTSLNTFYLIDNNWQTFVYALIHNCCFHIRNRTISVN